MLREFAQALAKQGYIFQTLRPDANKTTPSLVITVEWGYMNPITPPPGPRAYDFASSMKGKQSFSGAPA